MPPDIPASLADHLLGLERALQASDVRHSSERLDALLSPGFREFGRSGRTYSKHDVMAALLTEPVATAPAITEFTAALLSETVALLTYRSIRESGDGLQGATNRSSIWRLEEGQTWRMVFHQGTPTSQR